MTAASLFIWSAAAGVNRKDEISAGAVALAAMVGWWLLLSVLWKVVLQESTGADTAPLRAIAVASAPAGLLSLPVVAGRPLELTVLGFASAMVTHGFLASWYVRRFGRGVVGDIRSAPTAELCDDVEDWLPPPRR
jgi:hypothetical protein